MAETRVWGTDISESAEIMSGSEHPIEWYLARDGQQFGPLSDVELKKFVELGHLRPTDLLWRHGLPDWRPASSLFAGPRPAQPAVASSPPQQHAARTAAGDAMRTPGEPRVATGVGNPTANTPARPGQIARGAGPQALANGAGGGQRPLQRRDPASRAAPKPARAAQGTASHRRRFPWVSVTVCLLLAVLAGTALALHRSGKLSALMADFGLSDAADGAPGNAAEVTGSNPNGSGLEKTASLAAQGEDSLKISPLQGAGNSAQEVDSGFQKTALWRLLKKEFPDWYTDQVAQVARLRSEQKDDKAIALAVAQALVALRRKHINEALSASPSRLRLLASAFLDNLGRLAGTSIEACYGFISQGETSPMVVELQRASEHTANLQAQSVAVFEAIVEGRKSPRAPIAPRREDYDALAAQLAKRGWGPTDLQLFSDARALSRAAPQKVCQMVQDWFAAQLAVKDEEMQMRLLVEALKPVVSG